MSRAFTKEQDIEDAIVVPPRAPLPEGVANYVTPRGDRLLREERDALEAERSRWSAADGDPAERKRQIAALAERLSNLQQRLARTQVVDPKRQTHDVARFGAHVTLRDADGAERQIQIVGVDEADASEGRVAFTSPIARAVVGSREGDTVTLEAAGASEALTVVRIRYEVE